ncbi:MAG: T9SS type A sorting domain-containing protein, partial [Flavisolibacter sp.]
NGSATLSFDLLVNDNYVPVLTGVTNVTVKEKLTAQLNLMATDQNPADQLTWNITGLPSFATLTTNAGTAQIQFAPGYADNGTYPLVVTVEDGNTGLVTSNFVLTVTDVNPNKKIYVNFTDGTYQGAAPWNNTNKIPALNDLFANLNDETGTNSGISLQVTSSWQNIGNGTNVLGVNTGNNSGVYPDVVIRSAYFTTTAPQSLRIQGLDLNSRYKITFFGSRSSVSDNRNAVYTINGNSVMLNAASNSTNTVNLPNLQPNVDGTLDLTVQTGVSAQYAYLNAMVIESIFDDGTAPAKPRSLVASNLVNSIGLNWVDAAYNETSYQVYKSGTATGPYTLLNPGGNNAGLHTYNDESIAPNSTYYYYVTATNAYGVSPSSDTVVVETGNTSPVLAALANVTMETYQTVNVNVTATDEPGDVITLTAGNLPSFATFTDNGNGTGVLKLKPQATTGTFNNIQITATDNKGASSSKTFNLLVQLNGLTRVQVNFNQVTPVGAPWNSFTATPAAGRSLSNMVTTEGTVTTTGIALVEGWDAANNTGAVTGNNSGVFPDAVMSTAYYHSSSITKTIRLSGLSPARRYNLIFFGSRAGVNDNRTTMFSASGQSVTLNAASNTSNTVQINGLVPNSQGNLEFTVAKGSGSAFAYLNALVIESYVEGSGSGEGITLQASGISKTQIQLNWSTDAINQTACEVYRSTTQNGVYSLLTTLAGSATSYTDQNLSANTQFYYKLRTVAAGPVYSEYSNIATAATLSYLVYINFNSDLPAPAPWNNTNSLPQDGNVYSNMINDAGNPTGINMTVQGTAFNGVNTLGSVTGNNSGVYPDNVTRSTWWLDRGGVVRLKIDGLSQAMGYNFTFFASRDGGGNFADRTTLYTIGSKSTSLNAINNVSQTATIYNVRADNNGAVYIDIQAGGASPYAYIGALVIQAASVTELAEEGQFLRRGYGETTEEYVSPFAVAEKDTPSAFPNPFIDDVTLNLSLSQPVKQLKVQVLDVSGRVLFTKELRELNQGISRHKLGMNGRNWAPGIYMIEVTGLPGQASGTVQLIKK